MNRKLPPTIIDGPRAWSAFGFALTFPSGIFALWAGGYLWLYGHGIVRELVMAAFGLILLVPATEYLARTIRPNRFLLDDEGFSLQTWRGTRRWSWNAYRGLRGFTFQLLLVAREDGGVRRVPTGNWGRDLEHRFYTFASSRGASIAEPPPLRPSTVPRFLVSAAFVAIAVAVAARG